MREEVFLILPERLKIAIKNIGGSSTITEIRLRAFKKVIVLLGTQEVELEVIITLEEILQILVTVSKNSIYAIQQDINKGESFRSTTVNAVDTEYYILFRDKKPEVLQKRIHTLIGNLASSGLNSRQVSDDDLRVIIDSFFNGNAKTEFGTVMSSV